MYEKKFWWKNEENCTIHAGYVSGSMIRPWLQPCNGSEIAAELCPLPGIVIEILLQLAGYFNCTLNELQKFDVWGAHVAGGNGTFGGILGI